MDTIRTISGRKLCFVGQLVYESACDGGKTFVEAFSGVGVRLYRQTDDGDRGAEYLCVESAETGEEKWYRIDGTSLAPVFFPGAGNTSDAAHLTRPR